MSNKFHVLDHPMLLFAGYVESGHSKDLKPGQIGVFEINGNAVTNATINSRKPVRLAQGSYHTKDALGKFYTGLQKSLKTADFLPQDVMHIEYSQFRKPQNEKWIFGYDGLNNDSIPFECGKTHKYRVRVYGEGVYNQLQKQILRDVSITTACCSTDECADGCPNDELNCQKYTERLVNAINNDVEIGQFVKAEIVLPTAELRSFSATHKSLTLNVYDNGDQEALGAVQRAYPTLAITRIARQGVQSVYSTDCLLDAVADAVGDYTPTTDVLLAICKECEVGYTLTGAKDVYTIVRNMADYSSTADVIADYAALDTATILTSEVTIGTDTITETAHNFVTGQRVVYSNGGSTTMAGLTNGATYFVIKVTADTFKVATTAALAFAGTAVDITGTGNNAQTFTPTYTVTVLNSTPTTTTLQLITEEGVSLTAVDAGVGVDILTLTNTLPAKCTATAPSAIAWVDAETYMKVSRTATATISKECGGGSRLAEIQAYYVNNADITVALTTSGDCEDFYTITQTSDCMTEGNCLSEIQPSYNDIPWFEGVQWNVVDTTATSTNCGIRLEVSSSYDRFGNCSWTPEDYYSFKPTMMEIWAVEENGDFCKEQVPARKIQNAVTASQTGEWVAREYINLGAYLYHNAFESDPRLREVLDQTIYQIVDRSAYYNVYYFKFKQYRGNNVQGNIQNAEVFEIPIVAKEGIDTAAFESYLNKMFAPFGIAVQPREGQADY